MNDEAPICHHPPPLVDVVIGSPNTVLCSDWSTDVEARLRSVTRHPQPLDSSFNLQTYITQIRNMPLANAFMAEHDASFVSDL